MKSIRHFCVFIVFYFQKNSSFVISLNKEVAGFLPVSNRMIIEFFKSLSRLQTCAMFCTQSYKLIRNYLMCNEELDFYAGFYKFRIIFIQKMFKKFKS